MRGQEADKRFSTREDVVFTDLDDGSAVLLHLETKYYFSLNETGAFLWRLLENGGATESDLIEGLCEAFEVNGDQAKEDITEFIKSLREQGLIIQEKIVEF